MRYTLFISDLHLDEKAPELTALFCRFLQDEAQKADALYILGDLFEVWLGDDLENACITRVADALQETSRRLPIYFLPGNRDFLIGQRFLTRAGVQRIASPRLIDVYGRPIVVCHGDELCLDDRRHQRYRQLTLKPWVQKLFLSLPAWVRQRIADQLRHKSQRHISPEQSYIADVSKGAAEEVLRHYNATLMVHGHTHRPARHALTLDKQNAERIVLGAWHDNADFLRIQEDGSSELVAFRGNESGAYCSTF